MSTPPAVPRFLRFRWIFAITVAVLLVASVLVDFWRWWPHESWSQRALVISVALGFILFETVMLALLVKVAIRFNFEYNKARQLPGLRPAWPIWIGKWRR